MAHYECKKCGWSGNVNGRPRCLVCYRANTTAWRKANPEKVKRQKARYDKRFRTLRADEYNAKRRRYRTTKANHEQRKRRILWLLSGDVTRGDLIEIYNRDKQCVYCGSKVIPRFSPYDPRGFDHVQSRENGGKHEKSNIVVCCRKCNELKG